MSLFKKEDRIIKGKEVFIIKTPNERKLEYCYEPFYEYRQPSNNTILIECKSVVENGSYIKMSHLEEYYWELSSVIQDMEN